VVIDPFAPEGNKRLPKNLTADLVLVSHDHTRHNYLNGVGGEPFVIDTPGEFEVKDVSVRGVQTFHDESEGSEMGKNIMFNLVIGGVHIVHLGDLRHGLAAKHFEDFHKIDVLMVPVGGADVLDAKAAVEMVRKLEPRVIIPMHFRTGELCGECDEVSAFMKALGLSAPEPVGKLKLTVKDLPQDDMQIVIMDPQ
jgi:L-ascorbate metabolism protein UlaG (beta-lactamase superfamily)